MTSIFLNRGGLKRSRSAGTPGAMLATGGINATSTGATNAVSSPKRSRAEDETGETDETGAKHETGETHETGEKHSIGRDQPSIIALTVAHAVFSIDAHTMIYRASGGPSDFTFTIKLDAGHEVTAALGHCEFVVGVQAYPSDGKGIWKGFDHSDARPIPCKSVWDPTTNALTVQIMKKGRHLPLSRQVASWLIPADQEEITLGLPSSCEIILGVTLTMAKGKQYTMWSPPMWVMSKLNHAKMMAEAAGPVGTCKAALDTGVAAPAAPAAASVAGVASTARANDIKPTKEALSGIAALMSMLSRQVEECARKL